jgi:hypothetical protein
LGNDQRVDRLPHGYTNFTRRVGETVEKRYDGPRRWDNARRELACLLAFEGRLPVPRVIGTDASVPLVVLAEIAGRHGQELVDEGCARWVLRLVGEALSRLQSIDSSTVAGLDGTGAVIVHGDFGPQNMLFNPELGSIVGILDWESAHLGVPEEDLAWAEWIVRMHHPDATDTLADLFDASGLSVSWARRHDAMLRQCREILSYCESSGMERSAADWRQRLERTEQWRE